MIGILLIGVNVLAQGDLKVNGNIGVGVDPNSAIKLNIFTTNTQGSAIKSTFDASTEFGYALKVQNDLSGTSTGVGYGISLISKISSSASNVAGGFGANFTTSLSSDTAGTTNVDAIAAGTFDTVMNPGHHNYNITEGYGFRLTLRDLRWEKTGTYHYNDYFNVKISKATSDYDALSVDNLSGIWIEKQTLGGTSNYGIVLNGDGAGADLVFGDAGGACRPSIYATAGYVKAKNKDCVESPLSPHDPETGEWVFYSKNLKTGKVVHVNMEKLVKAVEKLTGEKFMIETMEEMK